MQRLDLHFTSLASVYDNFLVSTILFYYPFLLSFSTINFYYHFIEDLLNGSGQLYDFVQAGVKVQKWQSVGAEIQAVVQK